MDLIIFLTYNPKLNIEQEVKKGYVCKYNCFSYMFSFISQEIVNSEIPL